MSFEREIKKFLKQKNKQKSLILSGGSSITKIYKKISIYYLVKNVKKKMIINFNKDFLELNKFRKKYAK